MESQIKNKNVELNIIKGVAPNNHLPDKVHQIILGSLLGDMHCKRECLNSNIEETHSITQKDYLEWKYSILKNYFNLNLYHQHNPVCKAKGKIYFRKTEIRLRSKVSDKLNVYHNLFYGSGKKVITLKILDQLGVFGLAVWYCDDGYYDPENKMVEIHPEGFSVEENKYIQKWFYEKWNLKVNFKKDHSTKKVLLRFPVKETNSSLNLIKEHVFEMPMPIWYKLGYLWAGNNEKINNAKFNKKKRTKVYQSKKEIKLIKNEQAKNFYRRNRARILQKLTEYRKTKRYKDYIEEYHQREDVKEKRKEREHLYRQSARYKKKYVDYQKEYYQRPEVKEKVKAYNQKARDKNKRGD